MTTRREFITAALGGIFALKSAPWKKFVKAFFPEITVPPEPNPWDVIRPRRVEFPLFQISSSPIETQERRYDLIERCAMPMPTWKIFAQNAVRVPTPITPLQKALKWLKTYDNANQV